MSANIDHLNNAASTQDVANLIESRLENIKDGDLINKYESYQEDVIGDVNKAVIKFIQSMPSGQRKDFIEHFNTEVVGHKIVSA